MIQQTNDKTILYQSDFISIEFMEGSEILFVNWLRPVISEEYKKGYLKILDLLSHHKFKKWLIDIRKRGLPPYDDEVWWYNEYIDKLEQAITTKTYVALFLKEEQYNQHIFQYNLLRNRLTADNLDINYLTKEEELEEWMTDTHSFVVGNIFP